MPSVQFSSVAQSCPTLCDPMNCSTPGLPVHHQFLEFTQTHVHRVGDAIQPSHPVVPFSSCPQSLPASDTCPTRWILQSPLYNCGTWGPEKLCPWTEATQPVSHGHPAWVQECRAPMTILCSFCRYQFSSVAQSCLTLCNPMDWSTIGLLSITNSQSLLKLMSTELVMPSNHLILCHPLLLPPLIFPIIRVFSNESAFHIRWPKCWSFSFNISPSNEHSGLISFRMDWLDLLEVQGTLKSLLQHHSSKASILWRSRRQWHPTPVLLPGKSHGRRSLVGCSPWGR